MRDRRWHHTQVREKINRELEAAWKHKWDICGFKSEDVRLARDHNDGEASGRMKGGDVNPG